MFYNFDIEFFFLRLILSSLLLIHMTKDMIKWTRDYIKYIKSFFKKLYNNLDNAKLTLRPYKLRWKYLLVKLFYFTPPIIMC